MLVAPAVVLYVLLHDRVRWRYWMAVIGGFLGLYLLVLKGLDLAMLAGRLDAAGSLATGIGSALSFPAYTASWPMLAAGAAITAGSLWWARRQRALGFFGLALGLFLLGFSINAYMLIRAQQDLAINFGRPDDLREFWAVISREQYASAYGLLPRQVWMLATGKQAIAGTADLVQNIVFYFKYNVPFLAKYFGWQFGNLRLSLAYLALGLYGAFRHFRADRKSFWFWLAVVLITGPILNTYMNFKLEEQQFRQAFPADAIHEVRERDYFFIVAFVFFGFWSGLGLAGLLDNLRRPFGGGGGARGPLLAGGALLLLIVALAPLQANWRTVDRSGNYIPPVYARNLMNSMDPGGIVITNGDNDTFPLWYIQEVEGLRPDCRVVNLSLLNTQWYIRHLRDHEPKVPITLTDEQIDNLRPMRLDRDWPVKFGASQLVLPKGMVIQIQDIMVLHILQANGWKKPVYFATSVPESNRTGLTPYLTMEGAVFRVNPRPAVELAAGDSTLFSLDNWKGIHLDIDATRRLLCEVYSYDTFFRSDRPLEGQERLMIDHFRVASLCLAIAGEQRGQLEAALDGARLHRRFLDNPHEWDFIVARLLARLRRYDQASAVLDTLLAEAPALYDREMLLHLAEDAIRNEDRQPAEQFLQRSTERDPDFRGGYANLFLLYRSTGRRAEAVGVLERYLARFPQDTLVRQGLDAYRAGGDFDAAQAFQAAG